MSIDWAILVPLLVATIGLSASVAGIITARSVAKKTAINGLLAIIDTQAERLAELDAENRELRKELRKNERHDRTTTAHADPRNA